jgi:hypothetical protein
MHFPSSPETEPAFWRAIARVFMKRIDDALPRRVYEADKQWRELVPRPAKAGIMRDDSRLLARMKNREGP